jgi:hypothetical protein
MKKSIILSTLKGEARNQKCAFKDELKITSLESSCFVVYNYLSIALTSTTQITQESSHFQDPTAKIQLTQNLKYSEKYDFVVL